MGGLLGVKHFDGKDGGDPKHYFSVLSPKDADVSVSENLELPFNKDEFVNGGSCGGLLYFHGREKGQIVIVNLTTNEWIIVPPPDYEPPPNYGTLKASGLGYDAKSGDYKLIRHYTQVYCHEPYSSYAGSKDFFQLYRFKSFGSWKELRRPIHRNGRVHDGTGIYVVETGSCYWVASIYGDEDEKLETRFGTSPDDPVHHVVSFDFATESFGQFPLPATAIGPYATHRLVGYRGSLGALVYEEHCTHYYDTSSSSSFTLSIQLFVRKGRLWNMLYFVSLADVMRPVGLKDDRLVFVEAKVSGGRSQLMVYDLDTKQLKKPNIYDDRPRHMSVISYGESAYPRLPDSIPKMKYDFSMKMRKSNKGKKRSKKVKGRKSRR